MKKVQENQKNQKKKNKGFTLVELIIVIAIIAILAIVLAPQYIKYVEKSRWSNDINQINELESMVKTAIVEAQEANATADQVKGTITISKSADAAISGGSAVSTALGATDASWNKYRLKNNGQHGADASLGSSAKTEKYVITIDADGALYTVKGSWVQ